MEYTMNNEFVELNAVEMTDIDGGKWYHVVGGLLLGPAGIFIAEDLATSYTSGYNQGKSAAGK